MKEYIGCDAHKKYSVFVRVNEKGQCGPAVRVNHDLETYRQFLASLPPHSDIALEATGFYYWQVDEMEAAGHRPHLANPGKAKQRMGNVNKTDKLDAGGVGILLRNGTLPEVWIPPAALRDQRSLLRTRMRLVRTVTSIKNRIHGALHRYGLQSEGISDLFGERGRNHLELCLESLPEHTRYATERELKLLDAVQREIDPLEKHIQEVVKPDQQIRWLRTLPGVGEILGPLIAWELGDVKRFPGPGNVAAYAGLVSRTISSGGRTRHGRVSPAVNHYLKWAFVEAANAVVRHQEKYLGWHVTSLYQRLRGPKGHAKAATAVARHLAEASYWILRKGESYRDPARSKLEAAASTAAGSSCPGKRDVALAD
jgi:transposase